MSLWIKLVIKETKKNQRFFLFFISYLSIGLLSLLFIGSFRASSYDYLNKNLKNIFTADVSVGSRKALEKDKLQLVEQRLNIANSSNSVSFFSMAQGNSIARLLNINAIDSNFPLYGKFSFNQQKITGDLIEEQLLTDSKIWMKKNTRIALALSVGDKLKIGQSDFAVGEDLKEDPITNFGNSFVAPIAYVGINKVEKTGLLELGSRIYYHKYYKLATEEEDLKQLVNTIKKDLNDKFGTESRVWISSYKNSNNRISRLVSYFSGYFGLVSISTIFIVFIGIYYLFYNYFKRKLKTVAIFISLGAKRKDIYLNFIYQLFFLGFVSSLLATVIAKIVFIIINFIAKDYFPPDFSFQLNWQIVIITFCIGSLTSVLFCMPSIVTLRYFSPSLIFQEAQKAKINVPNSFLQYFSYFLIISFFGGLIMWQVGIGIGSIFLLVFLLVLALLFIIGYGYLGLCGVLSNRVNFSFKIILRNLYRNMLTNLIVFIALTVSCAIFYLIPQIQQAITDEIKNPKNLVIPTFFLFDIQPEQLSALKKLTQELGYPLKNVSPLIRARLKKVNGEVNLARTEDTEEARARSRRRGFNISYKENLSSSEYILEGKPLTKEYDSAKDEIVEISVEKTFADRQRFKIGDLLEFDISGISFMAKIVNFRFVKWNSFQPNFYVLFQTGVLEEAPQIFIASIDTIPEDRQVFLQNSIVKEFSNVSIINVTSITKSLINISEKVVWIISFLLVLILLAVLGLFYLIVKIETQERVWIMSLFKSFGSSTIKILFLNLAEFLILSFLAIVTGIAISYFLFLAIAKFLFDSFWFFNLNIFFLIPSLIFGTLAIICYFILKTITAKNPSKFLFS